MPSRNSGTPSVARGVRCPVAGCGHDQWYHTAGRWKCRECQRRYARGYKKNLRRDRPALVLFHHARTRASARLVPFEITEDDITAVWPTDGKCPALGIPLEAGKEVLHDGSPTLERLDNTLGYTPGNIAVISYAANRAKSSLTLPQMERLLAWMRHPTPTPTE